MCPTDEAFDLKSLNRYPSVWFVGIRPARAASLVEPCSGLSMVAWIFLTRIDSVPEFRTVDVPEICVENQGRAILELIVKFAGDSLPPGIKRAHCKVENIRIPFEQNRLAFRSVIAQLKEISDPAELLIHDKLRDFLVRMLEQKGIKTAFILKIVK